MIDSTKGEQKLNTKFAARAQVGYEMRCDGHSWRDIADAVDGWHSASSANGAVKEYRDQMGLVFPRLWAPVPGTLREPTALLEYLYQRGGEGATSREKTDAFGLENTYRRARASINNMEFTLQVRVWWDNRRCYLMTTPGPRLTPWYVEECER